VKSECSGDQFSRRKDGKVVQQTVAQFGELDREGRARAEAPARMEMADLRFPLRKNARSRNAGFSRISA
jgi:hypothetical protein